MQIFLHTPTGLALVENLDDATTIADLIDQAGLTDASAWIEDGEDALELTDRVAQVAGDKGHIHVNRCRRVDVTINYGGKQKSQGSAISLPASPCRRGRRDRPRQRYRPR
jgi:hypothetical protein